MSFDVTDFQRDGYALVENVCDKQTVTSLLSDLQWPASSGNRERNGATYAVRNLLHDYPAVGRLAESAEIRSLVEQVLGRQATPVRGILFDKTPGANWKVAWHQDISIAVEKRIDIKEFGPWSVKAGVVHVQPPAEILESMVTVRLHLDNCFNENGPVVVLPGSHRHKVLTTEQATNLRQLTEPINCTLGIGGVLLMRPLILHSSPIADSPRHRRVIHIEYASGPLPGGLRWLVS